MSCLFLCVPQSAGDTQGLSVLPSGVPAGGPPSAASNIFSNAWFLLNLEAKQFDPYFIRPDHLESDWECATGTPVAPLVNN